MHNKKISLCLGGGGARGFIHIGVLRYLEEQGYEVQEVSGTSMGAIIASALALGMNAQEIYEFVRDEFSYWKLVDFSFGKGVVAGDRIFRKFQEVYGTSQIDDTEIPLKIVATKLSNCEKVVFEKESILNAVRASMSVPGLFRPHEIAGESYVDGMMTENLPISPLRGDNILAISTVMTLEADYSSTKAILTKAMNKSNYDNEQFSLDTTKAHVELLRPVYDDIDFMDFHKYDTIVEIGYQAAKKVFG